MEGIIFIRTLLSRSIPPIPHPLSTWPCSRSIVVKENEIPFFGLVCRQGTQHRLGGTIDKRKEGGKWKEESVQQTERGGE